jgi:hypothetical protein
MFNIAATRDVQSERLGIAPLRGQVVTIQLSPVSPVNVSPPCIGWGDLQILAGPVNQDAQRRTEEDTRDVVRPTS